MNDPGPDRLTSLARRLGSLVRYGDGGQGSAIVALVIAAHKALSNTRFRAVGDDVRVIQHTPLRLIGPGEIAISGRIELGVTLAGGRLTGIIIARRHRAGRIFIDDGSVIGNASNIVSEGGGIAIGKRVLIGHPPRDRRLLTRR